MWLSCMHTTHSGPRGSAVPDMHASTTVQLCLNLRLYP